MSQQVESPLMRPGEAAAIFNVGLNTLRRWERAGRIACIRTPGGHRRYSRVQIARLIQAFDEFEEMRDGGET